MDIGAILVGLAVFIVACTFVAGPFGNQNQKNAVHGFAVDQKQIYTGQNGQKEMVLNKIRQLDFDYQTGKVGEEDYQPLRILLVAEAAQSIEAEKLVEAQLEEQLRIRRQSKALVGICPHCGGSLNPSGRFCSNCGKALETACVRCGKKLLPGNLFCPSCGMPVKKPAEAVSPSKL